jgi:hypothetical protein
MMNDELIRGVAASIARYLEEHCGAADTVEGVHYFWIGAEAAHGSIEVTQAALGLLLEEGRIARVPIANRVLWRAVRHPARD